MNASVHTHTPTLVAFDARGLACRTVEYCRTDVGGVAHRRVTSTIFDAAGRACAHRDPRLHDLHQHDASVPANMATVYSLDGQALSNQSVDAGLVVQLFGEAGQGVSFWDGRGTRREVEFDSSMRPLAVIENGLCTERFTYCGPDPVSARHNRCGQVSRHDDPAGTRRFDEYAMTGEVLEQRQHFLRTLEMPSWPLPLGERDDLLEPGEGACTSFQLNALGDVLQQTDAAGNIQGSHYTVDGRLREAWLKLKDASARKTLVSAITYDAHGRIKRKTLGNGVVRAFDYCPQDGLLRHLYSCRSDGEPLQDLHYRHDAVGNILSIEDKTLAVRFFANQRIRPISCYRNDSLGQLVEASGFEAGTGRKGPNHLADPLAVANFRQTYRYDEGGNLLELIHHGPQSHGRILKAAQFSNRCLPHKNGVPPTETEIAAAFDDNGNLLTLEGRRLNWDRRNQLLRVEPVIRKSALNDSECYFYSADGARRRKVGTTYTNARAVTRETRYFPGLETRSTHGDVLHVITVGDVQVLHWDTARPKRMANDQYRYTLDDHLGSPGVELDGMAKVVSRESYHPFGTTALWERGDSSEESYRTLGYSGKERNILGCYYYGFRFYVPGLMRWLNPDPDWQADGDNLYRMVRNNPMTLIDEAGKQPTRHVFDQKDIEGMSSIFSTIQEGLRANGLDPAKTLYILVGRSPLVLGAYIERSGYQIANLQISGMAGGLEVTPISDLDSEQKENRLEFLHHAFGNKLTGMQSVVVIDEGISGSSAFSATQLVKEYMGARNPEIVTKMATISQRINDPRYSNEEQKFLHHEDNVLYKTPLDKTERGVRRFIKVGTFQVDKGLAYVDKFNYSGMDEGLVPSGPDLQKKAHLDNMMAWATSVYGMNPAAVRAKKTGNIVAGNVSVQKYNRKNGRGYFTAALHKVWGWRR